MSDTAVAALDLVAILPTGERRAVRVRVAAPVPSAAESWSCSVSLEGLHAGLPPIVGEDSLQSLCLALRLAAALLHDVVARGGRLESATGDAFPLEAYFGGLAPMGTPAA